MYKELCTRKKTDKSGFGDKIHDYTLTIPMNQKSQPTQGSLILYLQDLSTFSVMVDL